MPEAPTHLEEQFSLSAKDVASMLRIPLPTVYHLVQKGELPGKQTGGRWHFDGEAIKKIVGYEKPVQGPARLVLLVGSTIRKTLEPTLETLNVTAHDFPLEPAEIEASQTRVKEVIITDGRTRAIPDGFAGRVIQVVGGMEDVSAALHEHRGPSTFSLAKHLDAEGLTKLLKLAA